jgi:acetyltransferase-like isoleucine patch superfamily enzyme
MNSPVLFNNVCSFLKNLLASPFILARLQKKYPNCHFYPGSYVDESSVLGNYNVIFNNTSIINSVLGNHTYVQRNSMIINSDIGKFCSVAMGIHIGLVQHATTYVSSHPAFYLQNTPLAKTFSKSDLFSTTARTIIGHDVWIGQNAMIMSGVKVGTGAIIGAGCVVTKDVPEYAIVIGMPAIIARFRFEENIRIALLKTEWWNMSDEWLERNYLLFSDPFQLIAALENRNGR